MPLPVLSLSLFGISPPANSIAKKLVFSGVTGQRNCAVSASWNRTLDRMDLGFEALKRLRARTACGPIEQLDRMHHWHRAAALKLSDAADIAGGHEVRLHARDVLELPVAQLAGDLRLEEIVGAGRAAADMTFRNFEHGEARLRERLRGARSRPAVRARASRRSDRQRGGSSRREGARARSHR